MEALGIFLSPNSSRGKNLGHWNSADLRVRPMELLPTQLHGLLMVMANTAELLPT